MNPSPAPEPSPPAEVTFADKPWLQDDFLPDNPFPDGWVIVLDGAPKQTTLEDIQQSLRIGPGRELWNGKMERELPTLVAPPGAPKLYPIMEIPALRDAFVENHRRELQAARNRAGWVGFPMLLIGAGAWAAGLTGLVLLVAVFGLPNLSAFFKARTALAALSADEAGYLARLAHDMRFNFWTFEHRGALRRGGTGWSRTVLMLGAWTLVAVVQVVVVTLHDSVKPRWDVAVAGLIKSLVADEPWRLLTATMMHGGLLHFIFNMGAAALFCLIVEQTAHRRLAAPIWLLGALAGSLVSTFASTQTSVGASGGILAWMAFALVMGWRRKSLLPPDFLKDIIRNVVLIAIIGVVAWDAIDNAAHLGGALAGAAVALWIFRDPSGDLPLADGPGLRIVGLVAEVVFVALTVGTVLLLLFK